MIYANSWKKCIDDVYKDRGCSLINVYCDIISGGMVFVFEYRMRYFNVCISLDAFVKDNDPIAEVARGIESTLKNETRKYLYYRSCE